MTQREPHLDTGRGLVPCRQRHRLVEPSGPTVDIYLDEGQVPLRLVAQETHGPFPYRLKTAAPLPGLLWVLGAPAL